MSQTVIEVENIAKLYRLGEVTTGTLSHDLNRWWHKIRGKDDPYAQVGQTNDRTRKSVSDYVWALKDINFKVQQGEVLGIIGRNGAGKSTLLKLLSRVTSPTQGTIKIRGRFASLLEVGTGFHPELTGRENVYLNGAILGMTRREISSKLDEIVEFSGCAAYLDTPVKRYSSGMKVRLAFAVAAHLRSEILIVDEVLAVGDIEFQKKCMGKMGEATRDGRTVLFVSHNMQAISTLTTRCLLMRRGTCFFEGSTHEAIAAYLENEVSSGNEYVSSEEKSGIAQLVRAKVETSEPSGTHVHGQPLKVHFEVEVKEPLQNASFSFQITDNLHQPIVHAWIFDSDRPLLRTVGRHKITCTLPHPRLYLGNYCINTYLADSRSKSMIESLESICQFRIEMHNQHREWAWQENACKYTEEWNWEP